AGDDAAVVAVVGWGDVPGVGRLATSGLADVAGGVVERGGGQEVDLGPGAALGAVDGPGPRMRHVGSAVGAAAGDEPVGQDLSGSGWAGHGQAVGGSAGHGDDGAVVPAVPVDVLVGVDQ